MQKRHSNRKLYFEEQIYTTQRYVVRFIDPVLPAKNPLTCWRSDVARAGTFFHSTAYQRIGEVVQFFYYKLLCDH